MLADDLHYSPRGSGRCEFAVPEQEPDAVRDGVLKQIVVIQEFAVDEFHFPFCRICFGVARRIKKESVRISDGAAVPERDGDRNRVLVQVIRGDADPCAAVVFEQAVLHDAVDEALHRTIRLEVQSACGRRSRGADEAAVSDQQVFCADDGDSETVSVIGGNIFNMQILAVRLDSRSDVNSVATASGQQNVADRKVRDTLQVDDVPPFSKTVFCFILVILAVHHQFRGALAADRRIPAPRSLEQGIAETFERPAFCFDGHFVGDHKFQIGWQDQRFSGNPVLSCVVYDHFLCAGIDCRLKEFRGILFPESPPRGIRRIGFSRFHVRDFFRIRSRRESEPQT